MSRRRDAFPPPETGQRHPSGGEGRGGRIGSGVAKQFFSSGTDTTGSSSSSVRRRPGGKGAGGAGRRRFCSHGELAYRRKQGGDGARTLDPHPNIASRHPGSTWSDRVYARWRSRGWGEHKRQTRSTARIWKGSRATRAGRRVATNWGRIFRPGGGEYLDPGAANSPPPTHAEGRGGSGESELRREGGGSEGGGVAPGGVGQLRAFIKDDQSGTTCEGCKPTIYRRHRVMGLPCGRQDEMHAWCVVNAVRRGEARRRRPFSAAYGESQSATEDGKR